MTASRDTVSAGAGSPWRRRYEHTQVGTLQIWAILAIMVLIVAVTLFTGASAVPLVVLCILVFAILCFATLTVTVHDDAVRFRFGPIGWFKREYPMSDIATAEAVQNPWYYGYGIRWTPGGPLYNVAGKDAVEICLFSGRTVRIGTDEPEALLQAIGEAKKQRKARTG